MSNRTDVPVYLPEIKIKKSEPTSINDMLEEKIKLYG